MMPYELKEIRPGHFAKIINGEVVGMASEGDVLVYRWLRRRPDVDSGMIEVAFAVAGLSVVMATLDIPKVFQLVAALAYPPSVITASVLCFTYVSKRIPLTITYFCLPELGDKFRRWLGVWLIFCYPVVLFRALRKGFHLPAEESDQLGLEIVYLTFLEVLVILAGLTGAFLGWILIS